MFNIKLNISWGWYSYKSYYVPQLNLTYVKDRRDYGLNVNVLYTIIGMKLVWRDRK